MDPLTQEPFEKLQALVNQSLLASLGNNSLLLFFESRDGTRLSERLVLRIHHPWRLLLGQQVVGESREFFSGGKVEAGQELVDWDRWSKDFANWVPGRLTGLSIGVDSPDLRLVFLSGHVLEAISEDGLPADWSLQLHKGPEILDAKKLARFPWGSLFFPENVSE